MRRQQFPFGRKQEGCIVELFRCVHVFGDAAAQNVGSGFNGER